MRAAVVRSTSSRGFGSFGMTVQPQQLHHRVRSQPSAPARFAPHLAVLSSSAAAIIGDRSCQSVLCRLLRGVHLQQLRDSRCRMCTAPQLNALCVDRCAAVLFIDGKFHYTDGVPSKKIMEQFKARNDRLCSFCVVLVWLACAWCVR